MKYHGFIFNDMKSAGAVPTKSAGSYSISSICRLHGYNIKVIDNIMFIIENNFEQLKDYLDDVVSGDTIFFGFSTTFMDDKYDWNYMHRKFESVEDRKSFENEIYDGAVELNKKYVSEVFLT
jgi:hypothetical protein